jgi:hypothetical protein
MENVWNGRGECSWSNNALLLLHCRVQMCKNCVYVRKLCHVLMSHVLVVTQSRIVIEFEPFRAQCT